MLVLMYRRQDRNVTARIGLSSVRRLTFRCLTVRRRPGNRSQGWLTVGALHIPVALGRSGIRANKREGDGGTPRGSFRLRRLWWRADRLARPASRLPVHPIGRQDAWCEDPDDRRYNCAVKLPAGAPGDRLWRSDHVYDYIVEMNHNIRPRVAGRGSAVFLHVARDHLAPTAGCVALEAPQLRRLLARLGERTRILIQ